MSAKLIIEVDFVSGHVVPDGKVVEWAKAEIKKSVQQAAERREPQPVSVGSSIQIAALGVECKEQVLGDGFIALHYLENGFKTRIDADGNRVEVGNVKHEQVLNELLMKLF
ncbi:hypothetical protein [Vibrio crassostreae]|uniref:hypothetical protein n=1 Tax=Vibrio crassostreae TaxID=246167 RepID=UPI001B31759A|nr:hypothetical protein [Vibrio crassostreae]